MKKKKLLMVIGLIVVLVVLAIPSVAYAATSDAPAAQAIRGFCGFDTSKLTDQQNADLNDSYQKMMDLREESINKMVDNGTITKEQGDAALKRIDDMVKCGQENGTAAGCMGGGCKLNGK